MQTKANLKICSCLLTFALAALSPSASFAEETGLGASGDGHAADHGSSPAVSRQPDSGAAARSDGKPDDIDTRITVQPHRSGKIEQVKLKTKPPTANLHRRTFSASLRATRNAVSVPSSRQGAAVWSEREHRLLPAAPHPSIVPGIGTSGTQAGPAATFDVRVGHTSANRTPLANSVGISRGAVNGSGVHQHFSAASLGGPATAISGINGTSIRPKH